MSTTLTERLTRLRSGELGPLPVIAGLVLIAALFQVANDRFLSAQNLYNLSLQIASTGVIALGIVFVLMIGEIDLSAGAVSGVTSAAMVVLNIRYGWDPAVSIVVAIIAGAAIGMLHGVIFSKLGVPSFVLTLGALLAWQGLQLLILGTSGAINIPYDGLLASFANTALPAWWGYVLAGVFAAVSIAAIRVGAARRRARGLLERPVLGAWVRTGVAVAALVGVTLVYQQWRGIPLSLLIFCGLVLVVELVLRYTLFGRRLVAVGGNPEAARRAGIRVNLVKAVAFSLCSAFAAFGGVLAVSRLFAVNQNSGGNDVLLNAIAAAVIGGTSLFGGRGTAYSALLGMLVIGAVSNGMDLLNQSSATKFIITGVVLVAAVVIDSVAHRRRKVSGR